MRFLLTLLIAMSIGQLCAQQKDSSLFAPGTHPLTINKETKISGQPADPGFKLTMKRLIVPASLIGYGILSQFNEEFKDLDVGMKDIVRKDPGFHTSIDNYLQYTPGLAVYVLNTAGVKGKNNFGNRTIIYLLSGAIEAIAVQSVKKIAKVQRPDGSGNNSFPSGHTATAFAGAEFLHQEYKDVSPWYGIAGYTAATATGILRMSNNKHWLSDVIAGAGFGILATKTAYWLGPVLFKKAFHKKRNYGPASY